MNNQEIKKLLTEYAIEDLNLAIESGSMCICGTKKGVVEIRHEDGIFEAWNNEGALLTGKMNFSRMRTWVEGIYVVDIQEEGGE